jgi:hypothetical protein
MNEKIGFSTYALVALIVTVILIASAFALSYSSLNSQISAKNQKISELNGKISSQNSTISTQNNTISSLKSNEYNMSLIVANLQSEITLANGNYSKLNVILSWVSQIYGVRVDVLAFNATTTVGNHTKILITSERNPSNNTTVIILSKVPSAGTAGGQLNGTYQNITVLINSDSQGGSWSAWNAITAPQFAYYFDNTGNVTETFSYTMLEIWQS